MTVWVADNSALAVQNKLNTTIPAILRWFKENSLIPNAQKFQCMSLGAESDQLKFKVDNEELPNLNCIKLLGVKVDSDFSFKNQVKDVSRIVAWKLSGINRLKRFTTRAMRWRLIQTYIIPQFDYASLVLLFLSNSQKRKLENMYRRCLQSATKDYVSPISKLLSCLNAIPMDVRWHMTLFRTMQSIERSIKRLNACDGTMEFLSIAQFLSGHAPIVFEQFFTLNENARRSVFVQPRVRTIKHGQNSVKFYGSSFWNKVPASLRDQHCRGVHVKEFLMSFLQKRAGVQNSIYD